MINLSLPVRKFSIRYVSLRYFKRTVSETKPSVIAFPIISEVRKSKKRRIHEFDKNLNRGKKFVRGTTFSRQACPISIYPQSKHEQNT
jgi:hypothetical protein